MIILRSKFYKIICLFSQLIFIISVSFAQIDELRFNRLSTSDGLASNGINDIIQDSHGFIWLATNNGLHRWDGYKIRIFLHDPNDSSTLSSSAANFLYEDSDNNIWIGAFREGLNRFNSIDESFTRYNIGNTNPEAHNQNIIAEICEDSDKNLWIGTDYGLLRFNRSTGQYSRFTADSNSINRKVLVKGVNDIRSMIKMNKNTLLIGTREAGLIEFDLIKETFKDSPFNVLELLKYPHDHFKSIRHIYRESEDVYWIAAYGHGLYRYEPHKDIVQNYRPDYDNNELTAEPLSVTLGMNSNVEIWLGTTKGLFKFNRKKGSFESFYHSSQNRQSISSSIINKVFIDQEDNLWIGTQNSGISFLPKWQKPFKSYDWNSEDTNSLGYGNVTEICEDNIGGIWSSSWGGGISYYDPTDKVYYRYSYDSNEPYHISSNSINSIFIDDENKVWIGSSQLELLDLETGSIQNIDFQVPEGKFKSVYLFCEGIRRDIWIGTKYTGFARFNREDESINYFYHDPDDSLSLSNDEITCIHQESSGTLWVGTMNGLNRLDNPYNESIEFKKYFNDSANPKSISYNLVEDLYQDRKGRLWVGTYRGLDLFDRKIDGFKHINIKVGSTNNIVKKILEDDHGNLWIRWGEKLVKYNPDTGYVRLYDERDSFLPAGVPGRWDEVLYIGKSGLIYYGGVNRFISFDPEKLKDNPNPPAIVFTDFQLQNKPVAIGENSPLKKSITATKVIELSHNENTFSFEFAALDYTNPKKNQYAYMMEGFDKDWIYTDASRRFATYTNLDPGEYIFRVKGSNNDGIWNQEGISIAVTILPPWWATTWAYAIYLLLALSIIYFTWKLQLKRIRIKNDYEMSKFEAKKLHEVDEMKSRFFANISHEFRTPLTLILGPVKELIKTEKETKKKEELKIVRRNADRLCGLVNQLLDLSKLEAGKMTLKTCEEDIVPFLKGLVRSFASLAERKKITLKINSEQDEIFAYIDVDIVEKIVINILSNAFKFTEEGKRIEVNIRIREGNAEIVISDGGIGIPKERLDNIFDRFYQVDGSHTRENEGTGIGLALTKELVELHKGEIEVKSEEGKGTTFTIKLPLGKKHLKSEEIYDEKKEDEKIITPVSEFIPEREEPEEKIDIKLFTEKEKPLLLIVEDNTDVRNYIKGYLDKEYRILEAKDGKEGLGKSFEHIPDLIISDVIMPKMDGFELCNLLKTDERTSHIPLILLTAKASGQDKIEGLETGADDYISKPFDAKELLVRVRNLIEQRKKIIEHFKKQEIFEISNIQIKSRDKKFISKAIEIINAHISDEDFDVSTLASEIGLSRVQLHRKLTALLGHSSSELIRIIKLTKAARLIKSNYGNITEIALEVGFNNPANFAKAFRAHFGVSPSDYKRNSSTS
jgi:signal transduction histidine kinase/ligand-binding sensor domain-containing protein/DNA-binding response OmpR family regulator